MSHSLIIWKEPLTVQVALGNYQGLHPVIEINELFLQLQLGAHYISDLVAFKELLKNMLCEETNVHSSCLGPDMDVHILDVSHDGGVVCRAMVEL